MVGEFGLLAKLGQSARIHVWSCEVNANWKEIWMDQGCKTVDDV